MNPSIRIFRGLVTTLLAFLALLVPTLEAVAAAEVTGIQLVNSVRSGRTTFDFNYRVVVRNGTPALAAASARVSTSAPGTTVIKGTVNLGDLAANATSTSTDTFTIRQDRLVAFDPTALVWVVTGTPVVPIVTVPNVVGLTQAAASSAITGAGLTVGAITQANSASVPAGNVISQNPLAGASVAPGSAVALVVSIGPANVSVPNVVGLSQAAASSAITGAGLTVGAITQANSASVPAGNVISQNPLAGASVAPGSAVALVVSIGPANVSVPNVVGLTQAAASSAITGAGLNLGTLAFVSSTTVPNGVVISQSPAAGASVAPGSSVELTVSSGPPTGPVPAAVELHLGSAVMAAGGSTPIVVTVLDASNQAIVPAPSLSFLVSAAAASTGGLPTTGDLAGVLSVSTAADTRGAYTLRVEVAGTSLAATTNFTVIEATPPVGSTLSNGERLVAFSKAGTTVTDALAAIVDAFNHGQNAAISALNAQMLAAAAEVPVTGRNGMERVTPVAPEQGFLPSTALLAANGFPETPGDVAFASLLTQVEAKLAQATAFFATLNAASTNDDEARLNQLNTDLNSLLNQLLASNVSPHGVVKHATRLNVLLGLSLPTHLQTVVSRVSGVLVDNHLAGAGQLPQQFFADLGAAPASQPAAAELAYRAQRPAFFGLVGLLAGSSLQMNLVNRIYGEYLAEVSRMMVILAVNNLLQSYVNAASMEGIISGASLSFHVPNLGGSVIEGSGMNTTPSRNDVFFIGPEAVSAVSAVLSSFNPSNVKSMKDLYKFFDGIVSALQGAGKAYANAHKLPDQVSSGCILDFGASASCFELVYNAGFPDVNDGRFPAPVIVLYHNLDTGMWAQGIFNFVAN